MYKDKMKIGLSLPAFSSTNPPVSQPGINEDTVLEFV